MADSLMKCLVEAGYKATRIASTIRKDEKLFDILVQQKSILPNSRIDFKTLADVLIQQVVIHTVDKKVCVVFFFSIFLTRFAKNFMYICFYVNKQIYTPTLASIFSLLYSFFYRVTFKCVNFF